MKKNLLIIISILFIVILSLPIIGNKIIESLLDEKLELATNYGVEISNSSTDTSYLNTKQHYEFLVKDSDEILKYIQEYSNTQLPPYSYSLLNGMRVGVDLHYSNLLFTNKVYADIYILSLPDEIKKSIKKEDNKLYLYLQNLINKKSILYHISYNTIDTSFDGYIKDIDEEYISKDNTKYFLTLSQAIFNGTGSIIAPESFNTSIRKYSFNIVDSDSEFKFEFINLFTASLFESKTTYASTVKAQSMEYFFNTKFSQNYLVDARDMYVNVSSNTQNIKAELYTKSSFKEFKIESNSSLFKVKDFNIDIAVNDIEKDNYEELFSILAYAKAEDSKSVIKAVSNLLSKGFTISIADLSFLDIEVDESESKGGISLQANILMKENKRYKYPSIFLADNIIFDSKLKLSNDIFEIINDIYPITILALPYAKYDADDIIYEIKYNKDKLVINGKSF